jgi:LysR family transcriptional activator of nhaA
MVPLNYNQLYYFYKIAESGSISGASKEVLISSPALSMQLKELEESLNTPLFIRSGKKLVLTDAGSIVFEYARDIFKLGLELKDTIGDRSRGNSRQRIEIGCQDTIPKMISDELLSFLIREKGCKITLREGNRERLIELQNKFQLDLILTNSVPQIDNEYISETRLLCREELIIVGHPKWKKMKSWDSSPLILPTFDSTTRQKLELYFREKNFQLDIIAEVEDKATEIDMAIRGLGLITAMRSSVQPYLKNKSLIQYASLKDLYEEVWMILGKRKILNPLAVFALKSFTPEIHR